MPKFKVTKSLQIGAPCDEVFATVSDFSTWTHWSPWLIAEPAAEVAVSGTPNAVGSTYRWDGEIVGAGELEHQELHAPRHILSEIRFQRPMRSKSIVSFHIEPAGQGSLVHWTMDGSLPWFLFWMRGMMETYIGMDYQRGLRMLKEWIEKGAISSRVQIHGVEATEALHVLGVRAECALADIGPTMKEALSQADSLLTLAGVSTAAPVVSLYYSFDMKRQRTEFTTGCLAPASTPAPEGMVACTIPQGNAFRVEHVGSYDHLANGWSVAQQHARHQKLKLSKTPYEIYRNSPHETAAEELVTDIYLPLR